MADEVPSGWEKDSEHLFVHASGVRIERRVYRDKYGWALVPVDLEEAVLMFSPEPEGREKAFLAFAAGVLKPRKSEAALKVLKEREEAESEGDDEDDDDA